MTKKRNEENGSGDASKKPAPDNAPLDETKRTVRMITAKDAGWITPTAFVLPLKLMPVDPPRPIKKRPRQ